MIVFPDNGRLALVSVIFDHQRTEIRSARSKIESLQMTQPLTLKHRKAPAGVISTVATDALVLKLQAISTHNTDYTFLVWDNFTQKYIIYGKHYWKILFNFEKKKLGSLRVKCAYTPKFEVDWVISFQCMVRNHHFQSFWSSEVWSCAPNQIISEVSPNTCTPNLKWIGWLVFQTMVTTTTFSNN